MKKERQKKRKQKSFETVNSLAGSADTAQLTRAWCGGTTLLDDKSKPNLQIRKKKKERKNKLKIVRTTKTFPGGSPII